VRFTTGTPACQGLDTELFFPEVGQNIPPIIKRICKNCPVFDECFSYAVTHTVLGIWAGTTYKQRQMVRSLNNIVAIPAYSPEDYGLPKEK